MRREIKGMRMNIGNRIGERVIYFKREGRVKSVRGKVRNSKCR